MPQVNRALDPDVSIVYGETAGIPGGLSASGGRRRTPK